MRIELKTIGFDDWFTEKLDLSKSDGFEIARVTEVHKESCIVTNGTWQTRAEITGKIMFSAESLLDFPTVGDWCLVQFFGTDSTAIIHEILPRKSILKRKTSGKKVEFQPIASNIDTAFIVQSLDDDFSIRRLERYLVMIRNSKIIPVILLSKNDLLSTNKLDEKLAQTQESFPDIKALSFSSENHRELDQIKELLISGKTFCLLGSSGVGKTTLLNKLLGEALFETQAVREKDSKGKHTTTGRQLISLENGAMIIDTPGMRELGNIGAESGIESVFDEFTDFEAECKYSDCSHTQEAGCAILEAISAGEISEDRYESFTKLKNESAHYERSFKEKKDHDKKLGKLIRSVKKHNQKGR